MLECIPNQFMKTNKQQLEFHAHVANSIANIWLLILYLWLLLETWHYKAYSTSSPLRVEHEFGLSDIVFEWRTDFLDFGEQIFLICKWLDNRRTDFLDFERTGRTGRTGEQIFHPSLFTPKLEYSILKMSGHGILLVQNLGM